MAAQGKVINLFVPGRLCLFGEHSDWAGMYRTVNADIAKGQAIVSGTEQGIYATAEKADKFIMASGGEIEKDEHWECEMDTAKLIAAAQQGGYFSYVAGVASYINDNYSVGGVRITILKRDLPIKSGLSSSAAICVLVARAFNQLYHLKMNVKGEMQAAYRGEQRTPSRCGRLDQACAYGVKPVLMEFDGVELDSRELRAGATFHWVIANLMASKDTIKILADLNRAYPFADNEKEQKVQEALGPDNQRIIARGIELLEKGDAEGLGALMNESQANFDAKVMPQCTELIAPVLHSVLTDPNIRQWVYGAKGVGSQGDGAVQFLTKDEACAAALQRYLDEARGMPSFTLTLKPGQAVKKAIIPLAGFGTRVFPETKCVRKCFMPLLDADGLLKPALLIMLENLFDADVEDVCLIIGEDERDDFERFFAPLPEEYRAKLPEDKQRYEDRINAMRQHITFVYQRERKGFGHAVWLAKQFTDGEPTLLLLGDFVYRSNAGVNCCRQVIDAYKECGRTLVAITEVPLSRVVHYGILHGQWNDSAQTIMKVDRMVEKPTDDYAREYLGVRNARNEKKYYATFGQYVLTQEVFEELDREIRLEKRPSEGSEYGLTAALDAVRERNGMFAFLPDGQSFDIGLPEAYRNTMWHFAGAER
ncbi:MAG: GHMP kinase [Clostridia bacterium]|nr:GHMP kinase [Clostridia bacterium]